MAVLEIDRVLDPTLLAVEGLEVSPVSVWGGIDRYENGPRVRSLPREFDDLTREQRFDIYETMLLDPQVKASLSTLIAGIIGGGMEVMPHPDDGEAGSEVAAFCKEVLLEHLESSFLVDVLPDMLLAILTANRIAEKVYYPIEESPVKGKYVLRRINPKPRRQVGFEVDMGMNVTGIRDFLARKGQPDVHPAEKFFWLTWKPTDNDPRGTSDGRAVWDAWWYKIQLKPEYGKYLSQFGTPSIKAIMGEGQKKKPILDGAGQPTGAFTDPAKETLDALIKFGNSRVAVFPNGTDVDTLQAKSGDSPFEQAFDFFNFEIEKALIYSVFHSGKVGSGSGAASVHEDLMGLPINYATMKLEWSVRRHILKQLVELNFKGAKVPYPKFPGAYRKDFLAWASAVAKLGLADVLHPEMYNSIFANLLNLDTIPSEVQDKLTEAWEVRNGLKLGPQPPTPAVGGGGTGGARAAAKQTERGNA